MVDIVVPVSGGKDSQACLQLAGYLHPHATIRGLFCDTQFEHPLTYQHVNFMEERYGIQIDRVSGGSVLEKCEKHGRFPSHQARFCTDELKMRVTRDYCKAVAESQGRGFEVWYGMRLGESHERRKRYQDRVSSETYAPHEVFPSKYPQYLGKMGVRFRLPILDWSDAEVLDFIGEDANPLYRAGFDRVGCFPCLAGGDVWKEKAFGFDEFGESQRIAVQDVSDRLGKSIWTSKGGQARNGGCAVCAI